MKIVNILLILSLFFHNGCSLFKKKPKSGASSPASKSTGAGDIDLMGDETVSDGGADKSFETSLGGEESALAPVEVDTESETKNYKVEKDETLMLIAFKLYGDYRKWRDLVKWNSATLKSATNINEGDILKYYPPVTPFEWNPEGTPYLILSGDTLGTISHKVYGTQKKWKFIWDNNRPLIKDPNLIFAGFTLYYIEENKVTLF